MSDVTPTPLDLITVGSLFVELTPSSPREALTSAHQYTLVAGGAAANVVFALARLGVRVSFITAVGDDDFGTLAINELASFGVDTSLVRRASGQLTPVSFAAIDGRGGKHFAFYRFSTTCNPLETLQREDFLGVDGCRLFDFNEGCLRDPLLRPLVLQAAQQALQAGTTVLYAVNLRVHSWQETEANIRRIECEAIALANIVVLNEEEVRFISGQDGSDGLRAIQAYGPNIVVMTRGGDGDMLLRVGEQEASIPLYQVPVIYDVGAGDTFHAGLVAAALRDHPRTMSFQSWIDAVRFAAATAALRVSTSADPHDLPTYRQVETWMEVRRTQGNNA